MKRILHFVALLAFALAYGLVKSPEAMVALRPYGFDLYQLGDLYRYSYLARYRDTTRNCPPPTEKQPKKKQGLFIIGDSFAGPFTKTHFPGVRDYGFANYNHVDQSRITVRLDTQAYNVLVLECSEKHVLMRFENPTWRKWRFPVVPSEPKEAGMHYEARPVPILSTLERYLGRPAVTEQNLTLLLFSNPAALRIKEEKAELNRRVFGRIADEVEEYPEKNMLLQRMTTDVQYRYMSSFRPHPESEYRNIAQNLGKLAAYYRTQGFDTVLLAIAPNPISVIDPNYKGRTYNQLLPWLEKNTPGLGMVSVYEEFKKGKETLYRRGDSHWNQKGERIWLGKVREVIEGME